MENTQTTEAQEEIILARPPEPKWFFYLIGFLIFPFGIFLGFLYLRKNGLENKAFGMRSIISGLVLPGILILIALVSFLLI